MSDWEKVGEAGVDSGLIWIGDPCYVVSKDASHVFPKWEKFCQELSKDGDPSTKQWGKCTGVSVSSGYGDGLYPVYVRRNAEGVIVEAKIVFDSAEEFLDDEGY